MIFTKEHLTQNYTWPQVNTVESLNKVASRRSFDRCNGQQLLFIINLFAVESLCFSIEECNAVENLIFNNLPLNSQSEISVLNWLKREYNK